MSGLFVVSLLLNAAQLGTSSPRNVSLRVNLRDGNYDLKSGAWGLGECSGRQRMVRKKTISDRRDISDSGDAAAK